MAPATGHCAEAHGRRWHLLVGGCSGSPFPPLVLLAPRLPADPTPTPAAAAALALASVATLGATAWREPLEDLVYGDVLGGGGGGWELLTGGLGLGDVSAAVLWSVALW